METQYSLAAVIISWLVISRIVYGSWPWEPYKKWYETRKEIKYLRDVIDNIRRQRNEL